MSRFDAGIRAWVVVLPLVAGCHSVLDVPVPRNVVDPTSLHGKAGGETLRNGAIDLLARVADNGYDRWSGMLTDEYREAGGYSQDQAVDSRTLPENLPNGQFDTVYTTLQVTRVQANLAVQALTAARSAVPGAEVAEAYAIEGYADLLLAESFCSGVPLSTVAQSGTVTDGVPITRDSLLGTAINLFDSASAHTASGDTTAYLVAIGAGRALLDRGQYAAAGSRVATVPATFKYVTQLSSSVTTGFYYLQSVEFDQAIVGDQEGTNGLNFVSANDPRVPTENLGTTQNGIAWIYPTNFKPATGANTAIVLASGVEAQLIIAEAALNAGDAPTWLATINGLRATAVTPAMGAIGDPGTAPARVDSMFTERAFWLFGTGHRLGDLRRLVRWYGRDQSVVFPVGTFLNGAGVGQYPIYGTATNFPIPVGEKSNPNFHGCLDRAA